jgi:hypothetical protein
MSQPGDAPRAISSDDVLPPVEPPSAGFIVQLFVVPMVIVSIVVAVYLMFNWLAQMGASPRDHLVEIRKGHAASWQEASNLAEALRRDAELRSDAAMADETGQLLIERLQAAPLNENDAQMRVFLCKALGEFAVGEAVPALVAAAEKSRNAEEVLVRQAALEALAVLAANLRQALPKDDAEATIASAMAVLLAAADDDHVLIKTSAAYALGVVGGAEANDKLAALLASAETSVRSNAAFGLARHGDPRAVPALADLLDPDLRIEDVPAEQQAVGDLRRTTILLNALRASAQLAEANSSADLDELVEAARRLAEVDAPAPVRVEARQLVLSLQARTQPIEAAAR